MEFDLVWVLLGLPLAFTLGWVSSRLDLRQLRIENRQAPKAYFRGLNFLLNEQQDQAIDAFIEAVQNDPDTSELHFALGNLFRRRGEYERAVRVHEHLLQRGDLTQPERDRAQHALALDYLKAGLLDRAEAALHKLEGTRFEEEGRLALLAIYERSRDWAQATATARKLGDKAAENQGKGSRGGLGDFSARQAHYLCEQAQASRAAGNMPIALATLQQATALAPASARPLLDLAMLQSQIGELPQALNTLQKLLVTAPQAMPLAANLLANVAEQADQQAVARSLLEKSYAQMPSLDTLQAIVKLDPSPNAALHWYAIHLQQQPSSLAAANQWLQIAKMQCQGDGTHPNASNSDDVAVMNPDAAASVQRALDRAVKPLLRYRCAACGFEASQHFWHCPGCQAWDSYPARRIEDF